MAVGLEMADDGLDRRPAAEFALDGAVNAALLARVEDPERLGRIVAAVT